jgi:hypothetical protein
MLLEDRLPDEVTLSRAWLRVVGGAVALDSKDEPVGRALQRDPKVNPESFTSNLRPHHETWVDLRDHGSDLRFEATLETTFREVMMRRSHRMMQIGAHEGHAAGLGGDVLGRERVENLHTPLGARYQHVEPASPSLLSEWPESLVHDLRDRIPPIRVRDENHVTLVALD